MSHSFPTRRSSELKAAVVVFVNSDFSNAFLTITQGIVKTAFPAIANAATGTDETVKTAEARKVYDQLVTGPLDRALMPEDANSNFTEEAERDYQNSLSPLVYTISFDTRGGPKLSGAVVYGGYPVTSTDRKSPDSPT